MQTVTNLRKNLKGVDGKLPLVYAKDNEGNGYQYVYYDAEVYYVDKSEKYDIEELKTQSDYDELSDEEKKQYRKVLVIN